MNYINHWKEKLPREALAFCLDAVQQDGLSIQESLERFPQHREKLEPLFKKLTVIRSSLVVSPQPEFRKNGYRQLLNYTKANQPVTLFSLIRNIQHKLTPGYSWRYSILQIILAAILALTAATGGVAYASDPAQPGDLLYGVDRAIEQARLDLTSEVKGAVKLYLGFTAERLEEVEGRLIDGDVENAQAALDAYNGEIAALAHLVGSPEGVDQEALLKWVNTALAVHQDVLTGILDSAPEQAQEAIQNAIDFQKNHLKIFPESQKTL